MKRNRPYGEDTASTSEKQLGKPKYKNVRLAAHKNNFRTFAPSTLSSNTVDLKLKNSEEINHELPSLSESPQNNTASSSIDHENKKIVELQIENGKLKEELSKLQTKQESNKKHENTLLKQAFAESKEHYRRAKESKIKAEALEENLKKSEEIVRTKESQRLQLQDLLNQAQHTIQTKDEENSQLKKLLNDNKRQTVVEAIDIKLENELRQTISLKDKTINGLHQKLQQAYKDLESQKDISRELEAGRQILENRHVELQETTKATKEKHDELLQQIEDLQHNLGQQKTENEQILYESQCERETFEQQLLQSRTLINEKNQEIAELRKKLDVQEVYFDEQVNVRIDVTESKAKSLENQYAQICAQFHELQQKYNNLERENVQAIEENTKSLVKKDDKIFELKKENDSLGKRWRSEKNRAAREIERLKSDKSHLGHKMKKKEDAMSSLQRHLENALQEAEKLRHQIEKSNEEVDILKAKDEKNSKNASNIVQLLKEVNDIRETLNEKDKFIAEIQKQKDDNDILLSQSLNEINMFEEKVKELQKLNDDLQTLKETEMAEIVKEKDEALLECKKITSENDGLISQKQRLENELSETQRTLQSVVTELVEEKAENEKSKEIISKSRELIDKAMSLKNEESLRADEAVARLACYEVQFLQNQELLKSEQEQRIHLQTQLLTLQQQINEIEDVKEELIKELHSKLSQALAEISNLRNSMKHLQDKHSQLQSQMEDERRKYKLLDGEYKRLTACNAETKAELEKRKVELSDLKKEAVGKNSELQKLCDESNVLLKKFSALSKK